MPFDDRDDRRLLVLHLRRALLRHRRLITATLVTAVVLAAVAIVAPPSSPTVPMVVAATDLPAGHLITDDDVREVRVEPGVVPGSALSTSDTVGEMLAAPVRAGEPLTDRRVVGPGLLSGFADGIVATAVPVPDRRLADLVAAGDHVDLYGATGEVGGTARLLVSDAVVITVPEATDNAAGGALLVLAVTPSQTAVLAQASATTALTVSIHR